ncbi:MAG: serine/threonine-protein kinase [Planctomycetota bacterium]
MHDPDDLPTRPLEREALDAALARDAPSAVDGEQEAATRPLERAALQAALAASSERIGPGLVVGELALIEELGRGGMGRVFLAEDRRTGARYALKVLLEAEGGDVNLERFRREGIAQAAADRHPHVLRVHATGKVQAHPYLVMSYASGGTLQDRLRAAPLPPEEAARVLAAIARGLASVHAQGVLHRDLKPADRNPRSRPSEARARSRVTAQAGGPSAARCPRSETCSSTSGARRSSRTSAWRASSARSG